MKARIALAIVILVTTAVAYAASKSFFRPKSGFVPDERTAIAIAVAVWTPIYGEKKIAAEKPYHAKLIGGVWHVDGSLPKEMLGGVAHVEIAKEDGRIVDMWHSQ